MIALLVYNYKGIYNSMCTVLSHIFANAMSTLYDCHEHKEPCMCQDTLRLYIDIFDAAIIIIWTCIPFSYSRTIKIVTE